AISTSMGARSAILVRDRLAVEQARDVDIVIFDKTGTLTEGRFGVTDMLAVNGWGEGRALALAAAVEGDSEHPMARGIRQKAEDMAAPAGEVSSSEAIKGRGIRAVCEGQTVHVGGPRLLE